VILRFEQVNSDDEHFAHHCDQSHAFFHPTIDQTVIVGLALRH
jgi:hypothetical protein